ncbi:unnamed protein product [Soboliphyme baturini]|uniref:Glycoprotein n=1 Tax=Soboliphyme baturini TaxID=241478 RepID=A0A183IE48_9BILA|nr:unnamed protein product [Soboliphyme baturini]
MGAPDGSLASVIVVVLATAQCWGRAQSVTNASSNADIRAGPVSSTAVTKSFLEVEKNATPHLTATPTTGGSTTTDRWYPYDLEPVNILGCKWPSDLIERVNYCVKKENLSQAIKGAVAEDVAYYGILSPKILAPLLGICVSNSCHCEMSKADVSETLTLWKNNDVLLKAFHRCLQKNTEGMARMCGVDTKVSSVVSGIIGVHINIMDLIFEITNSKEARSTDYSDCLKQTIEVLHETAALYLSSHFYVRNSVLCWDVTQGTCTSQCKKFGESIACLQKRCDQQRLNLRSTGVWEWFLKDPMKAKATCNISDEDVCLNSSKEKQPDATKNTRLNKLIDGIKDKWHDFKDTIENDLRIPLPLAMAVILSVFVIFSLGVALICMWRQGLIGSEARKDLRYTKLMPNRKARYSEEKQALTLDDQDEV